MALAIWRRVVPRGELKVRGPFSGGIKGTRSFFERETVIRAPWPVIRWCPAGVGIRIRSGNGSGDFPAGGAQGREGT